MQSFCGAHCRTTGEPCKSYSMPNGRCRMHGGKSTGRPITTGRYTAKAMSKRAAFAAVNKQLRDVMKNISKFR